MQQSQDGYRRADRGRLEDKDRQRLDCDIDIGDGTVNETQQDINDCEALGTSKGNVTESHCASTTTMTMKLADTEVKETIAKTIDKGNLGRDEKYKDGGAGLSKMVKDGGAGPGETVKGEGASQGQDTGDIDSSHYYPLVSPRPEEAPDIDNSTVVQCTGAERSPVNPLDVMNNALYSQHLEDGKGDDV
jgi:hypothetical protein